MGRLRLVVMRSHSEDERPDVVNWANASRQTGDSQQGGQNVVHRYRHNFMSDWRRSRGRGSHQKCTSTRSWNCNPLSANYTDMADYVTAVSYG